MVPSAFVVVDAIPLTSVGKIDLRALERNSTPEPVRTGPTVPPSTPLERVIAKVIEEVLGVSSISTNDNFFVDLGAHSLLVTKVVARLRELLRFELPLRWIFEAPTVRDFASLISAHPQEGAAAEQKAAIVVAVFEMSEEQVKHELSATGG
jgi:acyl carrier protein